VIPGKLELPNHMKRLYQTARALCLLGDKSSVSVFGEERIFGFGSKLLQQPRMIDRRLANQPDNTSPQAKIRINTFAARLVMPLGKKKSMRKNCMTRARQPR